MAQTGLDASLEMFLLQQAELEQHGGVGGQDKSGKCVVCYCTPLSDFLRKVAGGSRLVDSGSRAKKKICPLKSSGSGGELQA